MFGKNNQRTIQRIMIPGAIIVCCTVIAAYAHFFVAAQDNRLEFGATVNGSLTSGEQTDTWRLDGAAGDIVNLRIQRITETWSPAVRLLDPEGQLLLDMQWPQPPPPTLQFSARLHTTGPHILEIRLGSGAPPGEYELTIELEEPGPAIETGTGILTYGRSGSGTIDDTIFRNLWQFRGIRGDVVDIEMEAVSGDLLPTMALLSPDGVELARAEIDSENGASIFAVELPSSGLYTIVARRIGDNLGASGTTQGDYKVRLVLRSPGVEFATITPREISPDTTVRGRLTDRAPSAMFAISSTGPLVFHVTAPFGELLTMAALTPEGVLVDSSTGINSLWLKPAIITTETIWIEVNAIDLEPGDVIDFSLMNFEANDLPLESVPLHFGRARRRGGIPTEAYFFYGTAGDQITLSMIPDQVVFEGNVTLFAPDGSILLEQTVLNGFDQPLLLSQDGLFIIRLDDPVQNADYSVQLGYRDLMSLDPLKRILLIEKGEHILGGQAVATELEPSQQHVWTVEVEERSTWYLTLVFDRPVDLPLLTIHAPDGRLTQATRPVTTTQNRFTTQVVFPTPGQYQIQVKAPHIDNPVGYELLSHHTHGGKLATGREEKGILLPGQPGHLWQFQAGSDAIVHATNLAFGLVQPSLSIFGPDGQQLVIDVQQLDTQNSTATRSSVRFVTKLSGIHTILLHHDALTEPLPYRIAIENVDVVALKNTVDVPISVDSPAESPPATPLPIPQIVVIPEYVTPLGQLSEERLAAAMPIEPGETVRGRVNFADEFDIWSVTGQRGQTWALNIVGLETARGITTLLLDEEGAIVAQELEGELSSIQLAQQLPTNSTYYVAVAFDRPGPYLLKIDVMTDFDNSAPAVVPGRVISYGETNFGEIVETLEPSRFAFLGYENDRIHIATSTVNGQGTLALDLISPDGTILYEDVSAPEDTRNITLDLRLPTSGVYQLVVKAAEPLAWIQFSFNLELLEAGRDNRHTQTLSGPDEKVLVALSQSQRTQTWLIEAIAGEGITVRLESAFSLLPQPLILELTDTAGTVIAHREAQLGENSIGFQNVLLPRSGIYRIKVRGGSSDPGLIKLSFNKTTNRLRTGNMIIEYGSTVGGVLSPENNLEVWTFSGSRGDVISLAARPSRGDQVFINMQVRASNGQVLATAADNGSGNARVDNLLLPIDGAYSILVGNPDGSFNGQAAYALSLILTNTNARSMGTALLPGEIGAGFLFPDDPVDTWLINGRRGDTVRIWVEASSDNSIVPMISLLTTDWLTASTEAMPIVIGSAATVDEIGEIQTTLPDQGVYAIAVQNAEALSASYTLQFETSQTPATRGTLIPEQRQAEELGEGAIKHLWKFEAQANEQISILVEPDSRSKLALEVEIISPNNTTLLHTTTAPGNAVDLPDVNVPESGVYHVRVSRVLGMRGQTFGRYSIVLTRTSPPARSPQTITYDQVEQSLLNDANPSDLWQFEGREGDVVHIQAQATTGNLDTHLTLYGPNGQLVTQTDDVVGLDAEIRASLIEGGFYTVVVQRFGGEDGVSSGNYNFIVETQYRSQPETLDGSALTYGDFITGALSNNARSDFWKFAGQAGDLIAIRTRYRVDDAPPIVTLRDPTGLPLATGMREGDDTIISDFVLPADGMFFIEVTRPGDARASFTPYSLKLNLESAQLTDATGVKITGTLALDDHIVGHFKDDTNPHIWLVESPGNVEALLNVTKLSGSMAVDITVMAPDGTTTFFATIRPGQQASFGYLVPLRLNGTHILQLTPQSNTAGTMYRLAIQTVNSDENSGQSISPGANVMGTILDRYDYQIWSFQADAGEFISLHSIVTSGDLIPSMRLMGPQQQPLGVGVETTGANHLDSRQSLVAGIVAPTDGVYSAIVSAIGESTGEYRLLLRNNAIANNAVYAQNISPNSAQFKLVSPNTPALFTFDGGQEEGFELSARVIGKGSLQQLALLSEAGHIIAVAEQSAEARELMIPATKLPMTGRYIISITSSETASVELFVHALTRETTDNTLIRELARDQLQIEGVQTPDQTIHWPFTAQSGDVWSFTVDTSGGRLRASVLLFGPNGFVTGTAQTLDKQAVVLGPVRLGDGGDYQLVVQPWLGSFGGTTGRFELFASETSNDTSGSEGGILSIPGQRVLGGLTSNDPTDTWIYEATKGTTISFQVAYTPADIPVTLELHSSQDAVVRTDLENDQATEPIVLANGGGYDVVLSANLATNVVLEYELTLLEMKHPVLDLLEDTQPLPLGRTTSGVVPSGELYQAWKLYALSGDSLQIKVSNGEKIDLEIIDPTGRLIYGKQDTLDEISDIALMLHISGQYTVLVHKAQNIKEQNVMYRLHVARHSSGAKNLGSIESRGQATLTPDEPLHYWQLSPKNEGTYLLRANVLAPVNDVYVALHDRSGTLIAEGVRQRSGWLLLAQLKGSESYEIVVSAGVLSQTTHYSLELIPAMVSGVPLSIAVNSSDIGEVSDTVVSNVWQIQGLAEPTQVTIQVARLSGTLVPEITVFNENGEIITSATATDSVGSVSFWVEPETAYQIIVSRPGHGAGNTVGQYSIEVVGNI